MKKVWKFQLGDTTEIDLKPHIGGVEDYIFIDSIDGQIEIVGFIVDSKLTIVKGYLWDGCTPKITLFGKIVGVPDFKGTYKASLVHDFLIEYCIQHNIPRIKIDKLFAGIMKDEKFSLRGVYAGGVELFRPIALKIGPCN